MVFVSNMQQIKETNKDDLYMYGFRTKFCKIKKCRNPSKCFDAHSSVMKRRVPTLRKDGLFNYIPKLCPQWENSKKCNKGDSCHFSHGWLEIIFHPLLYKTKICKSNHKNGVCHEYDVYCAKAHNPKEIRNLVKIYGQDWKKHYDLSLRETNVSSSSLANSETSSKCKSTRFSRRQSDGDFVGNCVKDQRNIDTSNVTEQNKVGGRIKESPQLDSFEAVSPFLFASSPLFGAFTSVCGVKTDPTLGNEINSYIQLYSEKVTVSETKDSDWDFSCKFIDLMVRWDRTWNLTETAVPLEESSSSCSTNSYFMSTFRDSWKISETLDVDWKNNVPLFDWDKAKKPSGEQKSN